MSHLLLAILMIAAVAPSTAIAQPFSGTAKAIDGDSLMVGNQEVRLFGIDAPEFTQKCTRSDAVWACGSVAADQLSKKLAGQRVVCSSTGRDQYGRNVARCRVGDTELNRYMVATGYALAYRRYSSDYIAAEESAKLNKRGIWSGSFELPSEVRQTGDDYRVERALRPTREVRSTISSPIVRPSSSGCNIKGNHSRRGDLIYHLPGMPYYAQTRAEQMFCSEAEARAAGYRRSRADRHR